MRDQRPIPLVIAEDRVALAGVAGATAVIVGSFLTWASVPLGFTVLAESGLEADGKLTLLAGVFALGFFLASLRASGADLPVLAAVAALVSAAIALGYLLDVRAASGQVIARLLEGRGALDPGSVATRFAARPGPGLWVVMAGGVVTAGASGLVLLRRRNTAVPGSADEETA